MASGQRPRRSIVGMNAVLVAFGSECATMALRENGGRQRSVVWRSPTCSRQSAVGTAVVISLMYGLAEIECTVAAGRTSCFSFWTLWHSKMETRLDAWNV